jgi:hypothetical protein
MKNMEVTKLLVKTISYIQKPNPAPPRSFTLSRQMLLLDIQKDEGNDLFYFIKASAFSDKDVFMQTLHLAASS